MGGELDYAGRIIDARTNAAKPMIQRRSVRVSGPGRQNAHGADSSEWTPQPS